MTQVIETIPATHYRIRNVVKAETAKILTLRSTAITLGITVVAGLLVSGLVCNAALHHGPHYYIGFDATRDSLTGLIVAGLTGGVFGALLVTGEYASGTIRPTLAATPRRPIVLAAKLGVTALAMAAFCEILSFVSFFIGQAILSGGAPSASLGSPGALRAVVLTGLFIALMGLMSFGFGFLFRSTAAAIAAFVAVVFVLPLVVQGISERASNYLPTRILTNSVMATVNGNHGPNRPLSAGWGFGLMVLYTLVALAAGAVVFLKRDA